MTPTEMEELLEEFQKEVFNDDAMLALERSLGFAEKEEFEALIEDMFQSGAQYMGTKNEKGELSLSQKDIYILMAGALYLGAWMGKRAASDDG